MPADYARFVLDLQRLARALAALEPQAAAAGVAPPAGQEWFELLRNKLLAEIDLPPLLVVAIVGGTNIGKSVIFNHLAGEVASASSPLAAGTKHPVCLVPPELADPALLRRLFEPFTLRAWRSAERSAGRYAGKPPVLASRPHHAVAAVAPGCARTSIPT